ncbi:MAG TPA: transglutaminase family protein [Isosphaeraceae bacterium]|jgi:transglutaminase-like putative cysteine protease|nr:transglutaminase family protein [Isosphaeraceae bacterium]
MLFRITHETRLSYTEPVSEAVVEVRMAPASTEDQTTLGYRLKITPAATATAYRDGFGNRVDLFNVLAPHSEVVIRATSFARTHREGVARRLEAVAWPGERPTAVEALEFLRSSPLVDEGPELDAFRAGLPEPMGSLADVVRGLMAAVRGRLAYEKKVTTATTPVGEALALGRGVCQDFVHLFLGACRGLELPSRYVSGYVHQPGEIHTHAWAQVWGGESVGWVDVDPTLGAFVGDDHVVIAVGRDYSDVPPNRGLWRGRAREEIDVAVTVEPIDRMPADWSELGAHSPRAESANGQSQRQSHGYQSQRMGNGSYQFQRQYRRHGQHARAGYQHQQGQQQQGGDCGVRISECGLSRAEVR